ncbi:MAG: phosphatidylserine decarboxylase family protein [Desulfotomaculaceae bacterium]|nr:phosphatidylserine decarboxylase family protein [Desulfotomaculaceae bacterium]
MVNDNRLSRFALTLKLCWPYTVTLSVLAIIFYLVFPALAVIPVVLLFFVLFFFRNPKRKVPTDENCILSPADGVIMEIDEVFEDKFIKGPAIRISIFLSILNVHLNRSPLQGEVMYRYYRPGKFIPAFKSHASDINEKNYIGIESGDFKVMVCQITGFIARRIKCWADEGKRLAGGELIGIIKFGSGTEIFIPTGSNLYVKKGDKVTAGETALGMLPGVLDDNK